MFSWQDLDRHQPINWAHPLNRGRVGWWLAVPRNYGAPIWWDLVKGYPGPLSSFSAGHGWDANSNPGNPGSLRFDGTASYVAVDGNLFQYNQNFTLACWFRSNGLIATDSGLIRKDTQSGTRYLWGIGIGRTAAGIVEIVYFNGSVFSANSGTTRYDDSNWHRLLGTFASGSPGSINICVDGNLVNSASVTGTIGAPTGEMDFGADAPNSGGGRGGFFNGWINDVSIWNRPFSLADISEDYRLSKQAYPNVLRQRTMTLAANPVVTARQQTLTLLGCGV